MPEYVNWPDCPKYRTLKLSRLIDEKDTIMKSKMYLKVNMDINVSYEEANFLKETFMNDYDIREISMIQEKVNMDTGDDTAIDSKFESVDQIVTEEIVKINSEQFEQKMLLDIYNNL